MIYVLKRDNLYVAEAIGTIQTLRRGQVFYRSRKPNTKVNFKMTSNIRQARLVEDPNMDAVEKYGLRAVAVESTDATLKETGGVLCSSTL